MASAEQKYYEIIDTNCNAKDTYNFNVTSKTRIGHLVKLSFTTSGKTLDADTPLSNPEDPDSKIKVVGVIDYVKWEGGPTDPIQFEARISPTNKGSLQEALSSLTGGADVEAEWVIYEYDHAARKYFQRFHTDTQQIKLVITQGTRFRVSEDPDRSIQQPVNYVISMSLTAKSEGGDQQLCVANSASSKFTRQLGVDVSA